MGHFQFGEQKKRHTESYLANKLIVNFANKCVERRIDHDYRDAKFKNCSSTNQVRTFK